MKDSNELRKELDTAIEISTAQFEVGQQTSYLLIIAKTLIEILAELESVREYPK
jgi:hypothetical protein